MDTLVPDTPLVLSVVTERRGGEPEPGLRPDDDDRDAGPAVAELVADDPGEQAQHGHGRHRGGQVHGRRAAHAIEYADQRLRSEEHTSELQSLMRNTYAVFCLKKKNT